MKIKNEQVTLKVGSKKYEFQNLILDEYLKKFIEGQLSKTASSALNLEYCLLKFDTPFSNLCGASKLKNQDFDICFIGGCKHKQQFSNTKVEIDYQYEYDDIVYDYKANAGVVKDLQRYYGRKITAIGFNAFWGKANDEYVCAVLDTSNYNIYLQDKQDFVITRRDIIQTDAIFNSSNANKITGPVHLAPYGTPQLINQPNIYNEEGNSWCAFNDPGYGILYSVGLSSYTDYIDKEFIIDQDVFVEKKDTEITIKGLENYLSSDNAIFGDINLYPNENIYPIKSNYKYVILKYKVWQNVHSGDFDNVITTATDTGYFYYMAIPISKFGKTDLTIKYERG